ncbi:MAG: hypothetical protein K9M55_07930 [Candidatus Marinimicrobia bacterium]|nr:hypothetical protein [Candidatus Neomarinimicrobiota bacterium]MCF7922615.1 hypothetical protein [Candidatus Neomarinimicrobiota bacterium]
MKPLYVLLKREWLEWQRVILGTILIITFLNVLMLLSVSRGSHFFHQKLEDNGHLALDDFQLNDDEEVDLDIRMNGKDLEITIDGNDTPRSVEQMLRKVAVPVAFGLRFGMMGTFAFVLFLSMFYFSDAIFKERADNSTLFYRSLPVNDHQLLVSKIAAGLIGVIGLTLFLSIEFLVFLKVAIWIMGEPFTSLASLVLSQISYLRLIWDWFGYLVFAALHMAPLALFLMLVGSYVKGRPLIIGIGAPILLSISWAIIFQSAALLKTIGRFIWGFNQVIIDQWQMMEKGLDSGMPIYGNFWAYIFNLDTAISVLVSALLYYGIWHVYRKNIPTG